MSNITDAVARYEDGKQGSLDQADRVKNIRDMIARTKEEKAKVQEVLRKQKTNIIFAVDATASREHFWSETIKIQDKMFSTAQKAGANLHAQLVSYSGETFDGEIHRTPWHNDAHALSDHLRSVRCAPSQTQIEKVFRHALNECCKRDVHALILVGDSYEENVPTLVRLASQINQKGIKLFMFHDTKTTCTAEDTLTVFKKIAKAAEGFYVPFNVGDLAVLGDYLKVVGALATKNKTVIDHTGIFIDTPEGRDFLNTGKRQLGLSQENGPK